MASENESTLSWRKVFILPCHQMVGGRIPSQKVLSLKTKCPLSALHIFYLLKFQELHMMDFHMRCGCNFDLCKLLTIQNRSI